MTEEQKSKAGPGFVTKAAIAVTALAVVVMIGWSQFRHLDGSGHGNADSRIPVKISVGGPFTLTAHTGERVSDTDFRGRSMLIFFGYTFCPDVCPTELTVIAEALDILGPEKSREIQPIFVSVDPQRDTPDVMAEYVVQFHPSILGLTGSPEEIAAVAASFRAYYARGKESDEDAYTIDHSAITYLMGPDGDLVTTFSYGTAPEAMAAALEKFI